MQCKILYSNQGQWEEEKKIDGMILMFISLEEQIKTRKKSTDDLNEHCVPKFHQKQ